MTDFPPLDEAEMRHQICEVGHRLYQHFFVAANDGNISVRLNEHEILVTPANVGKGDLTPEMLVKITPEGQQIEPNNGWRASSESRMHLAIYRERRDIRAVVHAHPPTTGFAVANVGLTRPSCRSRDPHRWDARRAVRYSWRRRATSVDRPYLHDYVTLLLGNHGAAAYALTLREAVVHGNHRVECAHHLTAPALATSAF